MNKTYQWLAIIIVGVLASACNNQIEKPDVESAPLSAIPIELHIDDDYKEDTENTEDSSEAGGDVDKNLKIDNDVSSSESAFNIDAELTKAPQVASQESSEQILDQSSQVVEIRKISAEAKYLTPKGFTDMSLKVSLQDDKVVEYEIVSNPAHDTSVLHAGFYEEGIRDLVIGKTLAEIAVPDRINGASLTAAGFRKALEKLKEQS